MFFNTLNRLPGNNTGNKTMASTTEIQIYSGTGKYFAIPEDGSTLPSHALDGFTELEEVFIPKTITKLNKTTFSQCQNLKKIVWQTKASSSKKKGSPWGAPKTCEVVFDAGATPKKEDGSSAPGYVDDDTIAPVDVPDDTKSPTPTNYRDEMYKLLKEIRDYSKVINFPSMIMIGNGGSAIYVEDKSHNWTKDKIMKLGDIMDGCSIEDVWYGIDKNWGIADDQPTPAEYTKEFLDIIKLVRGANVEPIIIDYASTKSKVDTFYKNCADNQLLGYCSQYRELCSVPAAIQQNPNKNAVYNFGDIKNFLILLNPNPDEAPGFKDKDDYITQVANSDADLLILDIFYDGHILKQGDVKRLRHKSNGQRRQLIAYCSLGEAEDYRPYWKNEWTAKHPSWIDKENPDWKGNYKVKYWTDEWKKILFGTRDSYIDTIMRLGFDGLFLDVIDAYEYFEG